MGGGGGGGGAGGLGVARLSMRSRSGLKILYNN